MFEATCRIDCLIFALVWCTVTAFTLPFPTLCNLNSRLYLENGDETIEDVSPPSNIGLYVHIPYCRRRCRYCNFAIVPIGTKLDTDVNHKYSEQEPRAIGFQRMNQIYTAALLKELYSIQKQQDSAKKGRICLKSIYFGGGTPSLMPTESLRRIMTAIFCVFGVDRRHCEISMEVDPGTFTVEKLRDWKELGVNRFSLGVQSFDDALLESLGRVHRSEDIFESLEMIRQVYGDDVNYSIDLISGLPGLSTALWMETLQIATTVLSPRPKHLSVYDLQIEQVRFVLVGFFRVMKRDILAERCYAFGASRVLSLEIFMEMQMMKMKKKRIGQLVPLSPMCHCRRNCVFVYPHRVNLRSCTNTRRVICVTRTMNTMKSALMLCYQLPKADHP